LKSKLKSLSADGERRARRTARVVVAAEHEVIDEQLRAAAKQVRERRRAVLGVEPVGLVDAHPRQRRTPPREFVALPRQRLFGVEQRTARGQPFVARSGEMGRHRSFLLSIGIGHVRRPCAWC